MTSIAVAVAERGGPPLERCLRALAAQTTAIQTIVVAAPAGVVVPVGSGGARSTPEVLIERTDGTVVVRVNAAIDRLLHDSPDADCLCLVHEDVVVSPMWLEAVRSHLEADTRTGIVGARLLLPNGRTVAEAGGTVEWPRLTLRQFGHAAGDPSEVLHRTREVEFVSSAAVALRPAPLRQAGGFDATFSLLAYAHVDLSERVRGFGWRTLCAGDADAVAYDSVLPRERVDRLRLLHTDRLRYVLRRCSRPDDRLAFQRAEADAVTLGLSLLERRALFLAYVDVQLALPDVQRDDRPDADPHWLDAWMTVLIESGEALRSAPER